MGVITDTEFLSLTEAADILGVSTATIRNWMKSGHLHATVSANSRMILSRSEVLQTVGKIRSGTWDRLKQRRNKTAITRRNLPADYIGNAQTFHWAQEIVSIVQAEPAIPIPLVLCEVALNLIADRGGYPSSPPHDYQSSYCEEFFRGVRPLSQYLSPLARLLEGVAWPAPTTYGALPNIRKLRVRYTAGDDLLGLIYMALSDLGTRKKSGMYYTPQSLTQTLVTRSLSLLEDRAFPRIADPCCGSGNFLIEVFQQLKHRYLSQGWPLSQIEEQLLSRIHGIELDPVAAILTELNLLLLVDPASPVPVPQITNGNALEHDPTHRDPFDLVIGNPPWGATLSKRDRIVDDRNDYPQRSRESFVLFIAHGLQWLGDGGILSYILPEALLGVKHHAAIRKELLEKTSIHALARHDERFATVFTPSLLLVTQKRRAGPYHRLSIESFPEAIAQERFLQNPQYRFNINASSDEDALAKHMAQLSGTHFLKDHADFALGIVTGDNQHRVFPRTDPAREPILRGKDVFKYTYRIPETSIVFDPDTLQQVAPLPFYRAPEKIIYRFINKQLIFAYDNRQTLSLNSANLVIPRIPGYSIKYILAVLNSRLAQLFHQTTFASLKILRQHIECIPIPPCDQETQHVMNLWVDTLIASPRSRRLEIYESIDRRIMDLFHLNSSERRLVYTMKIGPFDV